MSADWLDGPLAVMDTETTGVDVLTDRIVTLTLGSVAPDGSGRTILDFIVNPGIEIPAGATATHGITTERARTVGIPAAMALECLASELRGLAIEGIPVVIFNATFDWPLIHAEAARHGIDMPRDIPLLDPLVIDRAHDRYRRGSRKLGDMAAYYGVPVDSLHASRDDAMLAGRIMRALAARHASLQATSLDDLQGQQREWFADWRDGFNDYLAKTGKADRVEGDWPWGRLGPETSLEVAAGGR